MSPQGSLLESLLASLDGDAVATRVVVGVHMTLVTSRRPGLAATMSLDPAHFHRPVAGAGRLVGRPARELAALARSDHPIEASIGVAALNSLIPAPPRSLERNAGDLLVESARGRRVALVGHFPFVPRLRAAAASLAVLERQPAADELPAEAAAEVIPAADVVGITGSALVNGTLDGLLALCSPGATVVVLGPSTPLSAVLFSRGASLLAGALVVDEEAVLRGLREGAHFRAFTGTQMILCGPGDLA